MPRCRPICRIITYFHLLNKANSRHSLPDFILCPFPHFSILWHPPHNSWNCLELQWMTQKPNEIMGLGALNPDLSCFNHLIFNLIATISFSCKSVKVREWKRASSKRGRNAYLIFVQLSTLWAWIASPKLKIKLDSESQYLCSALCIVSLVGVHCDADHKWIPALHLKSLFHKGH